MHIDGGTADICRPGSLIRAALFALTLLCASAALAGEDAPYPIWWSPESNIDSLDQFDEPFEKEFGSGGDGRMRVYKGEQPNKDEAYAYDCRSVLRLDNDGYFPKPRLDIKGFYPPDSIPEMDQFFQYSKRCELMEILRDTKPSQVSHVRDFEFDLTSIDYLPALIDASPSCDFLCRQYRANERGISWRDFEVGEFLSVEIIHKYHMVVTTDTSRADLEILAWADFNGDGTEDMLVQFIGGATHGTWGAQKKYILSRDEPEAVLRALNPEQYICSVEYYHPCDENYDYPEALKNAE